MPNEDNNIKLYSNEFTGMDSIFLTAAYYGDLEVLARIASEDPGVLNGKEVNSGSTALHLCAGLGHVGCVQYLLTLDSIDLFAVDLQGETALERAMQAGQNQVSEMLYDRMFPELVGERKKQVRINPFGNYGPS